MEKLFWRLLTPLCCYSVWNITCGWREGWLAGVAYNGLYDKTRRLWPCVVAHKTTNGILGIQCARYQEWQWWYRMHKE